jgi:NAD(P)-dependent dehydrogenase (short-subunit alcohol dehydrogenase family)
MLAGHHAVVTGAGRGIGAAIAAQLAAHGATLTLMGRNANVLEATAKTLPDSARAQVVTCDVTDEAALSPSSSTTPGRRRALRLPRQRSINGSACWPST